jgi:H+/Cl- antiporter ClcA
MGAEPTAFGISEYVPKLSAASVVRVTAVAVICAVVSIVFCRTMKAVREVLANAIENKYIRAAAGGLIVLALTIILQTSDYNGAGMSVIERAMYDGKASPVAFLLKIIFTAITIGAGFKGGEIVPTMFIGSTLGCVISPIIGLPPQFGAAIGLSALFCSVINCPIASIFLSLELFGSEGIVLFAVACGISYMLSGSYGLYSSQKIIYSKLHTKYINRHTK